MPEPLGTWGGVCQKFWGLRGGYAGTVVRLGRVCRNFCGVRAGVCRNFCVLRGEYAGNFVGSRGGMPELLGA